jgi:hypothetical protein
LEEGDLEEVDSEDTYSDEGGLKDGDSKKAAAGPSKQKKERVDTAGDEGEFSSAKEDDEFPPRPMVPGPCGAHAGCTMPTGIPTHTCRHCKIWFHNLCGTRGDLYWCGCKGNK